LSEQPEADVEAVLAWHDGDARAAIETLLKDCRYLRQQLVLTEASSSAGFTRGWRPAYERP
jgi:hypothetical protein